MSINQILDLWRHMSSLGHNELNRYQHRIESNYLSYEMFHVYQCYSHKSQINPVSGLCCLASLVNTHGKQMNRVSPKALRSCCSKLLSASPVNRCCAWQLRNSTCVSKNVGVALLKNTVPWTMFLTVEIIADNQWARDVRWPAPASWLTNMVNATWSTGVIFAY